MWMPEEGEEKEGGGGFGIPGLFGLGAGALGGFLRGRQEARNKKNDYKRGIAEDRALRPNRALLDATKRNVIGSFIENLGLSDRANNMGKGGTYSDFMNAVQSGVNPELVGEMGNISGVPGLRIGGKLRGEDPDEFYKPKGPGFLESLGMGAAKLFGG